MCEREQLFPVISNGVEGRQQFRMLSQPGKGAEFCFLQPSPLSERCVSKCSRAGRGRQRGEAGAGPSGHLLPRNSLCYGCFVAVERGTVTQVTPLHALAYGSNSGGVWIIGSLLFNEGGLLLLTPRS